jgi:hypothetical protein
MCSVWVRVGPPTPTFSGTFSPTSESRTLIWATHDFDIQVIGENLDPCQEVLHKDAPLAFVGLGPDCVHVEIRADARH